MSKVTLALVVVGMALFPMACGDPEVTLPNPLEVVYLPLDGAIDVEVNVAVQVYFSGEVDGTSVTGDSVMLEQAAIDPADNSCGSYQKVAGIVPAVLADDPQVVRLGTDADSLTTSTCYRITCTTDVQGVELGPLPDLGMDGRKGVAVDATFRTRD